MSLIPLSETDEWHLAYPEHDIRGREVRGPAGQSFGHVEELMVDPETQRVERVVLDSGRELPALNLRIGEGAVRFENTSSETGKRTIAKEFGHPIRVQPVQPTADESSFDDVFRTHFRQTYGATDQPFSTYASAYDFGRRAALQSHYRGRTYQEAEEKLSTQYERTDPDLNYDDAKAAIRFAFEHIQVRFGSDRR